MDENKEIVIFQDKNKKIEVSLKEETIWLTQKQIAQLFDVERSVITKHIQNIFKTGELNENSACSIFAHTASDGKRYNTKFYNLDVIISVGYRVNSKKATMFRIWATNVLKKYLTKGYAINESKITKKRLKELEETVKLIKETIHTPSLSAAEGKGLIEIIEQYANTWRWIEEFDSGKIEQIAISKERDTGLFKNALENIYQTFDGKELYPSFEEKAANLLYLIIKNHPFVDRNKRIGALLFLMFLMRILDFQNL